MGSGSLQNEYLRTPITEKLVQTDNRRNATTDCKNLDDMRHPKELSEVLVPMRVKVGKSSPLNIIYSSYLTRQRAGVVGIPRSHLESENKHKEFNQ